MSKFPFVMATSEDGYDIKVTLGFVSDDAVLTFPRQLPAQKKQPLTVHPGLMTDVDESKLKESIGQVLRSAGSEHNEESK